ncbi:hypothetical protein SADUNF_Sadunf13G0098800 [Salix dunnii]|uniref:Uncharacterized protein n=1 Tax=Salix dunnii TaxID=1413687 RepID=A0A835JGE3_9ROSI|nr:hypothetical protein SADUNF_Sadunf13G0098800 [Salix dunnii]
MAKKGRSQKNDGSSKSSKRKTRGEYVDPQNMDDDIDSCMLLLLYHLYVYAFEFMGFVFFISIHKQRDIIALDVDADVRELSDDEEEPIFDDEGIENVKGFTKLDFIGG